MGRTGSLRALLFLSASTTAGLLVTALGGALLSNPDAAAARKRGGSAGTSAAQQALEAAVDSRRPQIDDCVLEHAIKRGAQRIDIAVKVMVNREGQLMSCIVTPALTDASGKSCGEPEKLAACVKTAVQGASFPRSNNPLLELTRTWKFQIQPPPALAPQPKPATPPSPPPPQRPAILPPT